jgi:hypothetical protein
MFARHRSSGLIGHPPGRAAAIVSHSKKLGPSLADKHRSEDNSGWPAREVRKYTDFVTS